MASLKLVEPDRDEGAVRVETSPWVSEGSGSECVSRPPGGFDTAVRWRSRAGSTSILRISLLALSVTSDRDEGIIRRLVASWRSSPSAGAVNGEARAAAVCRPHRLNARVGARCVVVPRGGREGLPADRGALPLVRVVTAGARGMNRVVCGLLHSSR